MLYRRQRRIQDVNRRGQAPAEAGAVRRSIRDGDDSYLNANMFKVLGDHGSLRDTTQSASMRLLLDPIRMIPSS